MSPRTTAILAVIALALGAYVYFVEIGGEATRQIEEQQDLRLFPDVEADAIDAIEFETLDAGRVRFERRADGWRLPGRGDAPADPAALDGIASALAKLSREGQVERPGSLSPFGLDAPSQTILFEVEGRARRLRLGGTTPVGGFVYVTSDAKEEAPGDEGAALEVAFVESFKLNGTRRNLLDLRDRRLAPRLDALEAFTLHWPGTEIGFRKDESRIWHLHSATPGEGGGVDAGAGERADQETVRTLLDNLSYLKANGFVDQPDERARVAAAEAALEIRWEEAGETRRLTMGALLPTDEPSDALRPGGGDGPGAAPRATASRIVRLASGRLVTIAPERFADFVRSRSAYRDRRLAQFEVTEATRLEVRFRGTDQSEAPIELERGEGGWGWADGPGALDPLAVGAFVATLSDLRASKIVADEMGPNELAALGLAPPMAEIRVQDANRLELASLQIGRLESGVGLYVQAQPLAEASRSGSGAGRIFLVDAALAAEWPLSRERAGALFAEVDTPTGTDALEQEEQEEQEAVEPE